MAIAVRRSEQPADLEPAEVAGADDRALVAAAQVDPVAFGALWERYYDPVFRYCRSSLPTFEDAEDAANEIFMKALAALGRFRAERGEFRPWLFSIAHNELASILRRGSLRRFLPFPDLLGHAASGPSPEEAALLEEEWSRLLVVLDRFPADQRRVLVLRGCGLSGGEIAEVLGKRHDAIRKLQSRADARLRAIYREEERHGR
jgi:RNA polymerase sigma-70 factor (ECF subfamily)